MLVPVLLYMPREEKEVLRLGQQVHCQLQVGIQCKYRSTSADETRN